MVTAEVVTSQHEDAWLSVHRGGLSIRTIAADTGLSYRVVRDGVERAKRRGGPRSTESEAKPTRLVFAFGSSCKALPLLTCKDVHPCPTCRGETPVVEWEESIECPDCPGYVCFICRGVGAVIITHRVETVCEACDGSGVGPIPLGSRCCCAACHASGLDHRAAYQMTAKERRAAEIDRMLAESTRKAVARLGKRGGRK